MFDIISAVMWVTLGAGVVGLAFVEYIFSGRKKISA